MRTAETVKNKPVILQTTLQAVSCQRFTGKPPFLGLNRHKTLFSAEETHERTHRHQSLSGAGDARERPGGFQLRQGGCRPPAWMRPRGRSLPGPRRGEAEEELPLASSGPASPPAPGGRRRGDPLGAAALPSRPRFPRRGCPPALPSPGTAG